MKILVVGGAGYIGSHMVKMLADAGHDVVTLDSLIAGYRDAVPSGHFIYGDIADRNLLNCSFTQHQFDGVMHFASHIQVGESVLDPAKYYRNNLANTQNLLDAMVEHDVRHFVFSSTAAIFGEPIHTPIDEAHPKTPINPYGHSKLMVEQMLADYDQAYGLRSICLRYFNAAGAHPDGLLGERHNPETHLIPLILQAASGRREAISVFGRDYPTADGTCIRDYIHIMDLCQAPLLALEQLTQSGKSAVYNLGNGNGFSVQQVIDVARKVTGLEIKLNDTPRREGDPAVLVADSALARKELGWMPRYANIEIIVQHAWQWECKYFGNHKMEKTTK
jgi:UDP-glucose 4-epimerase